MGLICQKTKLWGGMTSFAYVPKKLWTSWIHDIWSKTISSKRRLVECDIWSLRRFADYDVSPTTTIGGKFFELRRNLVEIWSKLICMEK